MHVRKIKIAKERSTNNSKNLKDIEEWITKSCISSFISTSWLHTSQFFYYTHTSSNSLSLSFFLYHFFFPFIVHCALLASSPHHPSILLFYHSFTSCALLSLTHNSAIVSFSCEERINEWMNENHDVKKKEKEEVYKCIICRYFSNSQTHTHVLIIWCMKGKLKYLIRSARKIAKKKIFFLSLVYI